MISVDSSPRPVPAHHFAALSERFVFSNHRKTGVADLVLSFIAVTLGVVLSILIRFQMLSPGAHLLSRTASISQMQFEAVVAMHGTIMLFFVLAIAAQFGLGTLALPLQLGAREMAAPRLNTFAFWGACVSFLGVVASVLLRSENSSQTLWVAAICLFCLSAIAASVSFVVTAIDRRAPGLSFAQMPLSAWAWFVAAVLILMTCAIELASGLLLIFDRTIGTSFFYSPDAILSGGFRDLFGNSTLTWGHLFWFFADPFVYIVLLPAIGIVSHVLSVFCRKPLFASRLAVFCIGALGFLGFAIWGRHMFVSGLSPYASFSFSVLALSIGIPAMVMTLLWLVTLWQRPIERSTPMLFALGFVALFVTGGISGLFLALPALQFLMQGPEYVSGHFHLILAMAAVFAIFAGVYFWFPLMFGRRLNERWGKIHFWITFAGAYAIFLPLHLVDLASASSAFHAAAWLEAVPGAAALVTGAAQLIFVVNFSWTLAKGRPSAADPWNASSLEWSAGSAPDLLVPVEASGAARVPATLATVSLASVLVFFMALAGAYLIRRGFPVSGAAAFEPPRIAWIALVILVFATISTARACSLLRLGSAPRAKWISRWLALGALLALAFLAAQGIVWRELLRSGDLSASDPGRIYFLLFSGTQAALLFGGIAANTRAIFADAPRRVSLAEPLSIYWHFLAGLWAFLLALVSLHAK